MRTLAVVLTLAALLVLGARYFTGVVYEEDEPTSYLVWRRPGAPIARKATPEAPVNRAHVLFAEEPRLTWETGYLGMMRWATLIAGGLLLGAATSEWQGRRANGRGRYSG